MEVQEAAKRVFGFEDDEAAIDPPAYQMIGNSKVPISKDEGKLWAHRLNLSKKKMGNYIDAWNRNIDIYNNVVPKANDDSDARLRGTRMRLNSQGNAYENLIWSNTVNALPELFSQIPNISVTNLKKGDDEGDSKALQLQALINAIINRRGDGSLDLKNKGRKAILNAMLTNRGVIKVGYTFKEMSNEKVMADILQISEKLEQAKDVNEIKELEGQLQSLETMIELSSEEGPTIDVISPFNLFVDPTSLNDDSSDAKWIMERDWINTDYLRARYGKKENGKMVSIWDPSKDIPVPKNNFDDKLNKIETNGVTSVDINGPIDPDVMKKVDQTEVYWVWDRIKKRVLLFAASNWETPIWTWDDFLRIEGFFPYFILNFYMNPVDSLADGEINYYISIQNEINEINNAIAIARKRSLNSVLYNSTLVEKEHIDALSSGEKGFVGINAPPETDLRKMVAPMPTPAMDADQRILNKADLYQIIDKISSTDNVGRGEQYKTNTTNLAIASYARNAQTKIGFKKDSIEEFFGKICWAVLQMCMINMDEQQVANLIGSARVAESGWQTYDNLSSISRDFSLNVVGESIVKPTTMAKKEQSLQIAQILGQFASATPAVVVVMLKVLQKAFDEAIIDKEDWDLIMQTIQQGMMQQQAMMQNQQAQAQAQMQQPADPVQQAIASLNGGGQVA